MKNIKAALNKFQQQRKGWMILGLGMLSISLPLQPILSLETMGISPQFQNPNIEQRQTGESRSSHPLILTHQDSMPYLSQLEAQIIREMNQARANPGEYANKLETLKNYYEGRLFKPPGETPIRTQEGISAVNEAILALRGMDSKPSLRPSRGMSQAAADLVEYQGPRGETGHTGSDRSTPFDRMNRYGHWRGGAAENISYGPDTAEQVVMQLIIDDGVPSRGHRENIFNGEFRWTGVACGPHETYGQMCAIVYANGYDEQE
ncbi:CAP domain-containing protein [Oscillatoria sp. HE19RPO]|uniref:CAP domain-containing protein n=1 Tax=Oscillatoria sp. HE19RPO TaxID=2954806 RepID=UPI0020C4664F|nr:CAP domain-containing protein [Oscillatoria sp. HE19RPO]